MLINDTQTFETLFRNHYNSLCNYASKFIADDQAAEDIVQVFFISIWEKQHLTLEGELFLPYAYRAIRNSCINYYKHNQLHENFIESLALEWQEELAIQDKEFIYEKEVQQALKKLPEKCRKVFLLKCISELKYKEIAEIMGISANTVKYHLGEAFKIMKEELEHLLFILFLFFL